LKRKWDKLDPKKDTILNSVYLQSQQMKMYGGEEQNQMVDEMTSEEETGVQNPFDKFENGVTPDMRKSINSNPITRECLKYVDSQLNS